MGRIHVGLAGRLQRQLAPLFPRRGEGTRPFPAAATDAQRGRLCRNAWTPHDGSPHRGLSCVTVKGS